MKEHSVDLLDKRPDSTLNLYRKALNLRKTLQTAERLEWVETGNEEVLHFKRPGGWEVVLNGGKKAVPMPKGKVLLRSGGTSDTEIEGESCVWLQN
jgi:alpha-glucosidase